MWSRQIGHDTAWDRSSVSLARVMKEGATGEDWDFGRADKPAPGGTQGASGMLRGSLDGGVLIEKKAFDERNGKCVYVDMI